MPTLMPLGRGSRTEFRRKRRQAPALARLPDLFAVWRPFKWRRNEGSPHDENYFDSGPSGWVTQYSINKFRDVVFGVAGVAR